MLWLGITGTLGSQLGTNAQPERGAEPLLLRTVLKR